MYLNGLRFFGLLKAFKGGALSTPFFLIAGYTNLSYLNKSSCWQGESLQISWAQRCNKSLGSSQIFCKFAIILLLIKIYT